ncbi:MAG: Uncharacterised protein [Cellulomonadaceae bacterium TMED98]|nr:MAG: Uncharacterised protein [Cellulomonadaceae bacterium TMED98]
MFHKRRHIRGEEILPLAHTHHERGVAPRSHDHTRVVLMGDKKSERTGQLIHGLPKRFR